MTPEIPDGFPRPRGARQKTDDQALRNRRNRAYGHAKQAVVRRWLEALTGTQARFHGRKAHEETWSHLPVRVEVKAGQKVGASATQYLLQEKQADQAKAVGDMRPFVAATCPEGMSDFIVSIRGSRFVEVVNALGFYAKDTDRIEHNATYWTDQQGQRWVCTAYDHGPFCRLCEPVFAR